MLNKLTIEDLAGGINMIDLGSSGGVDSYWLSLAPLINLYAFDPNLEECKTFEDQTSSFHQVKYLPYAIAGKSGTYTLYKTRNPYCWSLLEPDTGWLERLRFRSWFRVEDTEEIDVKTLPELEELKGIQIDALKCDTQGLELPILKSIQSEMDRCFIVETETGIGKNYKEESTFHEVSEFMIGNGYRLFDVNMNHRISRQNRFARRTRKQEILWCNAIWMKDYVAVANEGQLSIDRVEALKALLFCANHGCFDFGFELATLFREKGLISETEYENLHRHSSWAAVNRRGGIGKFVENATRWTLNWVPKRWCERFANLIAEISQIQHPIRAWLERKD